MWRIMTLLRQPLELVEKEKDKEKELKQQWRENEIPALRYNTQFQIDALLNDFNYSIMR